jgi:hypothetical protein
MKQLILDEGSVEKAKSRSVSFRVLQLAITTCRLFASYILMLIAMTFNAGLLIAIILGLSTSYFVFGLNKPAEEVARVSVLDTRGAETSYIVARSEETTGGNDDIKKSIQREY